MTDRLLVLYRGRNVEAGPTGEVLSAPQHPYTRLLLESIPRRGWDPARIGELRRRLLAEEAVQAEEAGDPRPSPRVGG